MITMYPSQTDRQTDRQTDKHHSNSARFVLTNASRANNTCNNNCRWWWWCCIFKFFSLTTKVLKLWHCRRLSEVTRSIVVLIIWLLVAARHPLGPNGRDMQIIAGWYTMVVSSLLLNLEKFRIRRWWQCWHLVLIAGSIENERNWTWNEFWTSLRARRVLLA